jgi:UDP-3-O-[3-hydroxymyristoyl] glucosamine N-acyltransferase
MLRTPQPYVAFADAVRVLTPASQPPPGVSPLASVDPTAHLDADVAVGAFAAIGKGVRIGARTVLHAHVVVGDGAKIGADCMIHSFSSIRERVQIGDRVVLQDGAVIGSDGFGFARRADGTHQKIPQVGIVVIEDDVEIGAHSAVDRPAVGETRIAAGAKIDNLVQIAHGVKVGRNALLAAQVGIAGSSVLEDDVVMAGHSGVTGHVRVGKGVKVSAKSAITKDIPAGRHVAGIPAIPVAEWREAVVLSRKLPLLRQTLLDLVERVRALEKALSSKRSS